MDWRALFRLGHPSFRRLSLYADGDLDEEAAARTGRHLRECAACRRELEFIRASAEAAAELPSPRPPPGILEEVLKRRAAGERGILPVADPPPPAPRTPVVVGSVALAGLVVAATVLFLMVGSREASAGASVLRLTPEAARPGALLEVSYRTSSALAGEGRVRLSGRFRTAEDSPPRAEPLGHPLETWLEAVGPGRFEGEVQLPPTAVYAAFVVEDSAGERLDARGGRLWEVLVRDGSGAPTAEALRQRYRVMERLDPLRALETARRMTALYPNRAEGWAFRIAYERRVTPDARLDSLRRVYEDRFRVLTRVASAREANGAEELAALVTLAENLENLSESSGGMAGPSMDEELALWAGRLRARFPTHPKAVDRRVLELFRSRLGDPAALLEGLEEEWRRSGTAGALALELGFGAARRNGEAEAALRWAWRWLEVRPDLAASVAGRMADLPALRSASAGVLRQAIRRLDALPSGVPTLTRSGPVEREAQARERRRLLVELGAILAAEGRLDAALDTLGRATEGGWEPDAWKVLADVRRRAGDAAGALAAYGRVGADPLTAADSVARAARSALGAAFDPAAWEAALRAGARELRARVLPREQSGTVPGSVTLTDPEGRPVALSRLLSGRPGLLVSWTRLSAGSESLAELARWAPLLESAGVRLVPVTREAPSEEVRRFLATVGFEGPFYHDGTGDAVEALGLWLTPDYLVLDGGGGIWFRPWDPEEAVRRAAVLAAERRETG